LSPDGQVIDRSAPLSIAPDASAIAFDQRGDISILPLTGRREP
jgi:hypothetical protein